MTITALTCPATSADLVPYHPRILDAISPAQRDFSAQLTLAFSEMLNDLLNAGYKAALIDNSAANIAATKPIVCHKALSIIFLDLVKEQGDKWHMLYQAHHKQYELALAAVVLEYDDNEDGSIGDEEKSFRTSLPLTR